MSLAPQGVWHPREFGTGLIFCWPAEMMAGSDVSYQSEDALNAQDLDEWVSLQVLVNP